MQIASASVAEKLAQFLESNERVVDSLVGVYGYKDDWNVRDNRKHFNNQGGEGQGRKRNLGWKASTRPFVGKPQKNNSSNRHRGTNNTSTNNGSNGGNRNAWTNKNRRQSNPTFNADSRRGQNQS